MSHGSMTKAAGCCDLNPVPQEERAAVGVYDTTLRLSVGIEAVGHDK